jgi:hypothetical protein
LNRLREQVFRYRSVSLARFAFQACSFIRLRSRMSSRASYGEMSRRSGSAAKADNRSGHLSVLRISSLRAADNRRLHELCGASLRQRRDPAIPECVKRESQSRYNGSMKTTIDIPEKELRDAMRFTRATTKREAVVKILEEFNRRRRMAELVKYAGTFSDQFPANDEMESIDGTRDRNLNARSRR